jgi:hypothetical protein
LQVIQTRFPTLSVGLERQQALMQKLCRHPLVDGENDAGCVLHLCDAAHDHQDVPVEMIGLMPMVRELEDRLAADVEFKGGGA